MENRAPEPTAPELQLGRISLDQFIEASDPGVPGVPDSPHQSHPFCAYSGID